MYIGLLRHRITIQRPIHGVDTHGGPTVAYWDDVATVWASLDALRGTEFFAAQQIQSNVTVRIRIRYRADIMPDMRVLYRNTVYGIEAILPDKRCRETILMCREASFEQEEQP